MWVHPTELTTYVSIYRTLDTMTFTRFLEGNEFYLIRCFNVGPCCDENIHNIFPTSNSRQVQGCLALERIIDESWAFLYLD